MASYLESDRVSVREYLGFSSLFLQADPRLESAITASQAIADGGTRPDNSLQLRVLTIVAALQAIDAAIDNLLIQQGTMELAEAKLNSYREMIRLKARGRIYVHRLARVFDTLPRADCFGPAVGLEGEYPAYPRTARMGY